MKNNTSILPGQGLGDIKFGISRDQLKAILGEPNEIERLSHSDHVPEPTETWHYDELDLSAGFDEAEDWRLISLSITSDNYSLKSKHLIGLKKDELVAALEGLGIDDHEFQDKSNEEDPTSELIFSESLEVSFWMENEVLAEIEWSPLFLDENTISWPE